MSVPIKELKGMTAALEVKLKGEGINNTDQLLAACKTPANRKDIAAKCGVDAKMILELANRADLTRINGVAGVFSDLLENAGVDTVKELATRSPDNLHAKLEAVHTEQKIGQRAPNLAMVQAWVAEAKGLPKGLDY